MVEIQDLVKVYAGQVAALKGVSLEITKGMFGLLGPNGSGKTTLMRILAGLLEPTSGRILFDGVDITQRPELLWPRLGNLPQDFGFYPNLTGEAMLMHMLRLKGVEAPGGLTKLCADLLERVNLTDAAKRKTKEYSGGMRRRLGIAQAIAGDPALIIVDEPTAGLDPEERLRFYGLLTELAADRTVLLSTHIVEDVATLCPQFALIRSGRVLTQTTPSAARAKLDGKIFSGSIQSADLQRLGATTIVTKAHLMEGRNMARVFVENGKAPDGFVSDQPTLEDAYMLEMHRASFVADNAESDAGIEATT
jgi:ABC-type multidrug transport system ATPase subunit